MRKLLAISLTALLMLSASASGRSGPQPRPYQGPPIATGNAERCDWLDPSVCLYPFPNNRFTVADRSTDTDRRVAIDLLSSPRNRVGKPIDTAELNRNDGFSPGAMIVTRVPGLDTPAAFARTGAVRQTNLSRYDDRNQPVVVINARSGERHPIWAELDSNPRDRADVTLIIRPAVNFKEGARYLVALRDLRDAAGHRIRPRAAFRVYRDRLITDQPEVEGRRPQMERILAELRRAGIGRRGLYLAWEFTVASERSLAGRMLHIRDDAFAQLGDNNLRNLRVEGRSPAFTVDTVTDFGPGESAEIAREVTGTVTVPCYMSTPTCLPVGSTFLLDSATGLPRQLGAGTPLANRTAVPYTCRIPRPALEGSDPPAARPSLYGHGLLGSQGEVDAGHVSAMAAEHNFVFCAVDWYGFATTNLPNIALILQDVSFFPLLADGTQQGFLNFLYLGRLMIHRQGLVSHPAFRAGGEPVIDTRRLFYDGNSQGGILGGALTAVAPDFQRAVLGVPGMNYSTLLRRSVDFEPYAEGEFGSAICELVGAEDACPLPDDLMVGLYDNYPDELERPLIFALMQMLWDRAEANGYAQHMTTDPLPDTPQHRVLLHPAFGDHQVANIAAEVEARTIGARIYRPALDPGRHSDRVPFFGLRRVPRFPYAGSAIVYWDGGPLGFPGGTATPVAANLPPRPPRYGEDPHSYPRNDPKARAQKSAFLRIGGRLINPCRSGRRPIPCYANDWTGP